MTVNTFPVLLVGPLRGGDLSRVEEGDGSRCAVWRTMVPRVRIRPSLSGFSRRLHVSHQRKSWQVSNSESRTRVFRPLIKEEIVEVVQAQFAEPIVNIPCPSDQGGHRFRFRCSRAGFFRSMAGRNCCMVFSGSRWQHDSTT